MKDAVFQENDLVTSFNTGKLHFCFRYSNSAFSVVLSIYNTGKKKMNTKYDPLHYKKTDLYCCYKTKQNIIIYTNARS